MATLPRPVHTRIVDSGRPPPLDDREPGQLPFRPQFMGCPANLERLPHHPSLCDGLIRSLTRLSRASRACSRTQSTLNILNQVLNQPLNSTLNATQHQGEMYPLLLFPGCGTVCVCVCLWACGVKLVRRLPCLQIAASRARWSLAMLSLRWNHSLARR
jgi:hypothetical protein